MTAAEGLRPVQKNSSPLRPVSPGGCEQHGKLLPHWRIDRRATAEETTWELLACGLDAT